MWMDSAGLLCCRGILCLSTERLTGGQAQRDGRGEPLILLENGPNTGLLQEDTAV